MPDFRCLVCGTHLKPPQRSEHLKSKHPQLCLEDVAKYHIFGWYDSQCRIPVTNMAGCPACNSVTPQVLYMRSGGEPFLVRVLLRCHKCGDLFWLTRKFKPSQ